MGVRGHRRSLKGRNIVKPVTTGFLELHPLGNRGKLCLSYQSSGRGGRGVSLWTPSLHRVGAASGDVDTPSCQLLPWGKKTPTGQERDRYSHRSSPCRVEVSMEGCVWCLLLLSQLGTFHKHKMRVVLVLISQGEWE